MKLSTAHPQQVDINGKNFEFLGFYFPGENTDWDNVYGVPYFGNFWEEQFEVQLKGSIKGKFYTAEAAYQASKWWNDNKIRTNFEAQKTGNEAFSLKNSLKGIPYNGAYGGYNSGEEAMFEILKQKFDNNHPDLQAALGATGNAYLLEHGAVLRHQDRVWSDGNDGNGTNHLGLCLMDVREYYFPGQGNPTAAENGRKVILTCEKALRAEMTRLGLSADNKEATTK